MTSLAFAIRLFLILIFAEAAYAHLRDPQRFRKVLRQIGLPSSKPFALGLTVGDIGVAIALGLMPRIGGLMATVYVAGATSFLGWHVARGGEVSDCGCSATKKSVNQAFFVRNATLVAGSLTVVAMAHERLASFDVAMGAAAFALLAIAHYIPSRRTRALAPTSNAPATDGVRSRRQLLRLGLQGAGAGAIAAVGLAGPGLALPMASNGGARPGRTSFLAGEGADEPDVKDAQSAFPDIKTALATIPAAASIGWTKAAVLEDVYEDDRYYINTRTVYAPIRSKDGEPIGLFARNALVESRSKRSGATVPIVEERAQLVIGRADTTSIVLVGHDGKLETRTLKRPSNTNVFDAAPTRSSDPLTELCDSTPDFDTGCNNCHVKEYFPCPGGDQACVIYSCHRAFKCKAGGCAKEWCHTTCNICSGWCCGDNCTTCGSCN